jgi:hypothetical protein
MNGWGALRNRAVILELRRPHHVPETHGSDIVPSRTGWLVLVVGLAAALPTAFAATLVQCHLSTVREVWVAPVVPALDTIPGTDRPALEADLRSLASTILSAHGIRSSRSSDCPTWLVIDIDYAWQGAVSELAALGVEVALQEPVRTARSWRGDRGRRLDAATWRRSVVLQIRPADSREQILAETESAVEEFAQKVEQARESAYACK